MKAVIQRVSSAKVTVDKKVVGEISAGLMILLGLEKGDLQSDLKNLAQKIANLRIFSDEKGRFQHSLLDIKGEALVVSQFTLCADTSKGRRPEFFSAMPPEEAKVFYEDFINILDNLGVSKVSSGEFGAMMEVSLVNDGPVTITL